MISKEETTRAFKKVFTGNGTKADKHKLMQYANSKDDPDLSQNTLHYLRDNDPMSEAFLQKYYTGRN